jgi:hypothetical protein
VATVPAGARRRRKTADPYKLAREYNLTHPAYIEPLEEKKPVQKQKKTARSEPHPTEATARAATVDELRRIPEVALAAVEENRRRNILLALALLD